jgi:hypothetical protein
MFAGKAGAYPSESPLGDSRVDSWPYQQTLNKAGKACQGQNTLAYSKIRKLRRKKVL